LDYSGAGAFSRRRPHPGGSVEIGTMAEHPEDQSPCRAREILQRVGDKWSIYVVNLLGQGTKRFGELRKEVDGITPRMLTVTVRSLERDGLIERKVYPVIPPRVEYSLTPLGQTLLQAVTELLGWADQHIADIEIARDRYDRAQNPCESSVTDELIELPSE
jgi:DNA-binding HxlR family transcriptional regulator